MDNNDAELIEQRKPIERVFIGDRDAIVRRKDLKDLDELIRKAKE